MYIFDSTIEIWALTMTDPQCNVDNDCCLQLLFWSNKMYLWIRYQNAIMFKKQWDSLHWIKMSGGGKQQKKKKSFKFI